MDRSPLSRALLSNPLPDMEKHPSSLALQAEIFWGFGGNILKWLPLFCDAFGGKQKKLDIIWQIQNSISSTRCFICTDIKYFHQLPYLHESSAILPIEAYITWLIGGNVHSF